MGWGFSFILDNPSQRVAKRSCVTLKMKAIRLPEFCVRVLIEAVGECYF